MKQVFDIYSIVFKPSKSSEFLLRKSCNHCAMTISRWVYPPEFSTPAEKFCAVLQTV